MKSIIHLKNLVFKVVLCGSHVVTCRFKLLVNSLLGRSKLCFQDARLEEIMFLSRSFISGSSSGNIELVTNHFRKRKKPFLFFENGEVNLLNIFKEERLLHVKDTILKIADQTCDHLFELLGASLYNAPQTVAVGQPGEYIPIDWHSDFKTGYRWNQKKYYLDIEIPCGMADIKVPWELSRFQHLVNLGQAYWLSGDEKYAKEFVNQISDWIDHNQPQHGVNWRCTMDVAIRAVNWIAAYCFFKDSDIITQEFLEKFLKSLFVHGRHIRNNLENWAGLSNNHYLSNLVGLVYLGAMFPEFKDAKSWKEFGVRELKRQIRKQVYPDGCDFEGSVCYHRLAVELFFYPALLLVINNQNFTGNNYKEVCVDIFGKDYTDSLYKMFEVVLYVAKPDGKMPQVGDNDNGRLLNFSAQNVLDVRYLLNFGAVFFREPRFKVEEFGFSEEALWVCGERGRKIWDELDQTQLISLGGCAFFSGGWFVLRNSQDYMMISAGPNGLNGLGGHNHNDKLSFELMVGGKDIIVDPGTYAYTAEPRMRNLFRSTVYHNTVVIDESEQNRFDGKSLFKLENDATAKCLKWDDNFEESLFIGEHNGYARLREPIVHRRLVRFLKLQSKWIIKDEFYGIDSHGRSNNEKMHFSQHTFDWRFHLAPQASVQKISERELILQNNEAAVIFKINKMPPSSECIIEDGWFSSAYGEKVKNKIIKLSCRHKIFFEVEFEILKING